MTFPTTLLQRGVPSGVAKLLLKALQNEKGDTMLLVMTGPIFGH